MAATSVPPPTGAATPIMLGRYRLDRRLATGGMSEVWVATDTLLDRQVAVKLLKPALAADPVVVERFQREAIAAAGLNHPSIVSVYDTVSDGGRQGVVMELVPGRSLRVLLDERGRLRVDDTLAVGRSVATALAVAHRSGLVHRDIKPGNILVTTDGRVKLTDFGIAKAIEARDDLTADNVMMGTAKYLAPEQVLGRPLDGRADLYALGLVLYECLTGRVPFAMPSDAATAVARLHHDPLPLRDLRPDIAVPVADAVHALLARRPDDRIPDAGTARAVLTAAAGGADVRERIATTPPGAPRPASGRPPAPRTARRRRRNRWMVPTLALAGVAVAGVAVAAAVGDGGAPESATATTAPSGPSGGGTVPPVATGAPAGLVGIAGVSEFDPEPGDGREHPELLGALTDGDPSTSWTTVCYESEFLYPKDGVGLVIELDGPAAGNEVRIAWPEAPWGVRVYVADSPASSLDGWGSPIDQEGGTTSGEAALSLGGSDGRHVLLWLTQVPRSPACSVNPYQGSISGVSVGPAG